MARILIIEFVNNLYIENQKKTMNKKILLSLALLVAFTTTLFAQEYTVDIEDERKANRVMIYAVNKNLVDLDVKIKVSGTGFKQRKGIPRKIRVPATSRVQVLNLIQERRMQAIYTYELEVSDSLTRRSLRKPFELIKIDPKKPITVYIPEGCTNCDTIINPLKKSPYKYREYILAEQPEVKKQLAKAFIGASTPLDEMTRIIVSLGGKMYMNIDDYDELMAKLNEE